MKTPEEILHQYIFDSASVDGLSYDDAIICMNELARERVINFHRWRADQPNQVTGLLSIEQQYELFLSEPPCTTN